MLVESLLPWWYWPVVAALFGAVFASFGAVLVERLGARVSLSGRSRCSCGRTLAFYENVPVLSWLALRGRARCCRAAIPGWYLLAEVGAAVLWAAVVLTTGPWALPPLVVLSVTGCIVLGMRRRAGPASLDADTLPRDQCRRALPPHPDTSS